MTGDLFNDAGATFCSARVYRYRLWRRWGPGPRVLFCMLNPSTADEVKLDATITRCLGFARDLGAGTLEVVNLFALRSTDPRELARHAAPVGPENDTAIAAAAQLADHVICAWGADRFAHERARRVLGILRRAGAAPTCLRQTKDGHPSHPLYLPATLRPVPYEAP
jgi:hypothetical protein